jgi:hypothetical protein
LQANKILQNREQKLNLSDTWPIRSSLPEAQLYLRDIHVFVPVAKLDNFVKSRDARYTSQEGGRRKLASLLA